MALVIAGERSGVGKTTVTLALLAFLAHQKNKVQSFKVGPDYIDPMFHTAITGRPCRNLDPVLTSQGYVQSCFTQHCQGVDYALIEGVMGLFDGVRDQGKRQKQKGKSQGSEEQITKNKLPINDFASTAHIARLLNLPVVLVIDCSRLSGSVAALAQGYRTFDPRVNLVGVVLNRVGSDRHLELLQEALEPLNLTILGVLRRQTQITIPDRHLGLVTAAELDQLPTIFAQLAHLAQTCFDWEQLFPLLEISSREIICPSFLRPPSCALRPPIKIAIARDRAFSFYYPDNLEILGQLGGELISWSPLEDNALPQGTQGLYLGGGFPEVFAQALAENWGAREAVRAAIGAGMPTYAECGGLMYLCEKIVDFAGQIWPMVGILPTTAVMGQQLTLGYRQARALQDSLIFKTGEKVRGHEFHRSALTCLPQQPLFQISSYLSQTPVLTEGWQLSQLHASYLHLHFGQSRSIPKRFLQRCLAFPD